MVPRLWEIKQKKRLLRHGEEELVPRPPGTLGHPSNIAIEYELEYDSICNSVAHTSLTVWSVFSLLTQFYWRRQVDCRFLHSIRILISYSREPENQSAREPESQITREVERTLEFEVCIIGVNSSKTTIEFTIDSSNAEYRPRSFNSRPRTEQRLRQTTPIVLGVFFQLVSKPKIQKSKSN